MHTPVRTIHEYASLLMDFRNNQDEWSKDEILDVTQELYNFVFLTLDPFHEEKPLPQQVHELPPYCKVCGLAILGTPIGSKKAGYWHVDCR